MPRTIVDTLGTITVLLPSYPVNKCILCIFMIHMFIYWLWKNYFEMFLGCRCNALLSTCSFSIFSFDVHLTPLIFIYIWVLMLFYLISLKNGNVLFCCLALNLSHQKFVKINRVLSRVTCNICDNWSSTSLCGNTTNKLWNYKARVGQLHSGTY